MLLPGGPGYVHDTGKAEEFCLKTENGSKIFDQGVKEHCYVGDGVEVVMESQYKWMLNWVEVFEKLEGPFEGSLKYVLPLEAPHDKPELDFVKPKFYLPAQAHPVFELGIWKGIST